MKTIKLLSLLFLGIFLLSFASASTRYEYQIGTGNSDTMGITTWCGQNFTIGTVGANENFHVDFVNISIWGPGLGFALIGIRNVDATGHPTGVDLCNGTIYAGDFPGSGPSWHQVNLTNGTCDLLASGQYAIIAHGTAGSGTCGLKSGNLYSGGTYQTSADSGSSWTASADYDMSFEVWGSGVSNILNLSVNLTYPENLQKIATLNSIFNASITPIAGNITNATFYVWNASGIFNKTTTFPTGNITNYTWINITSFAFGQTYHWNVYGCVENTTDYLCDFADSNYTFISSAFSETNVTYNKSVFETSTNSFILNISANPLVSAVSSYFWYNGTRYSTSTIDGTAGIYRSYSSIDIPLAKNQTENKSFLWEFTFTLTTGEMIKQNSSTYNQEVNMTYLSYCNATFTTSFINFTTREAENPFPNISATIKTAWNFWIGGGTISRKYSFENLSETISHWTFCAYPNVTFNVNTNIEYDATGFAQNFYYLTNASLTNNSVNQINLYLLNDSKATVTELIVEDNGQNPIANATIQIQLYDVGTDTFYTVAMAKTSFNGKDIVYLNWYSTLYKFIITKNGEVLKTTDPYKISETPQTFVISEALAFAFDKFRNFVYNLYYNNATSNFVLTFTKPSGLVDEGCLRVIKRTATNDTQICLTCETSSSATLYCNIGSYGNGTYIAAFYATGSWWLVDVIYETIGKSFAETIYDLLGNEDATAYAFLFSGIVVAMFFLSPVLAIVGLILGILGGAALGFTVLNYFEFMGIIIVGAVIAWLVKR